MNMEMVIEESRNEQVKMDALYLIGRRIRGGSKKEIKPYSNPHGNRGIPNYGRQDHGRSNCPR